MPRATTTSRDVALPFRDIARKGGDALPNVQLAQARRVTLLVLAILLMGLADLSITLTYMRSIGMIELNPIARHMVSIGSCDQLIRYKLFTMGLSCGVLYLLRRHPRAELGAWICAIVLLGLTLNWVRYNESITDYTNELHVIAASAHDVPTFVRISRGS